MHTVSGSPYYMAPEVLKRNYSTKSDVWSVGVICHTLCLGYLPFDANYEKDIFKKILNHGITFNSKA